MKIIGLIFIVIVIAVMYSKYRINKAGDARATRQLRNELENDEHQ